MMRQEKPFCGQGAAVGVPVALPETTLEPCCDAARRLEEFGEWLDVMLGAALVAHHDKSFSEEDRGLRATRDQARRQGVADALRIARATLHEQEPRQDEAGTRRIERDALHEQGAPPEN